MALRDQDFEIWQGEEKDVYFTITGDSSEVKDLTGATITWKAMRHPSSTAADITCTTTDYITISGATSGIFKLALASSHSTGVWGKFYHEARVVDTLNYSEVVATGLMIINRSGTL